ncbi:hypothetical protein [Methylophaga sp.]|uniref:hypothetical protein n=1 Tax=Methylophaga sp. TaxID=2024840 RepID=UPI003A8C9265
MKTKITKALIIDDPWVSRIINGEKDWEMRSFSTRIRGPIGLIRKGSLQVVGIADFHHVSGPYDNEQLIANTHHHTIPSVMFDEPGYKWRFAWEFKDAQPLDVPVTYQHKNGAVTWVELNTEATEMIAQQLSGIGNQKSEIQVEQKLAEKVADIESAMPAESPTDAEPMALIMSEGLTLVPVAKDGSRFSPDICNNNGVYTVGDKGDEQKFRNFQEALDYLKSMPVAKWRRPNVKGNYGIVTAVEWVEL